MRRKLNAVATALLALCLTISGATMLPSNNDAFANEVTPAGQAAFGDLTACLTSSKDKRLDVFYLIDNSNSLQDTDPQGVRFDVLENSIAQLGDFADSGVKVRYAAAIFSTDASPLVDWTEITDGASAQAEGQRTAGRLESLGTSGRTDWEDGVRYAYDRLEDSDACRAMIWFTDGAINPENNDEAKFRSLDALCHSGVSSGSLDNDEYGLLARFKQDNISVFAVLLEDPNFDAKDKYFVSYLKALVEGSGELVPFRGQFDGEGGSANNRPRSGELNCSNLDENGLALPGQSNGALLRATDPVALAYQFLKLETQIAGGSQGNMVDGKFTVRAGTVGFRIVALQGDWSIRGPEGSDLVINSVNADENEVEVVESSGLVTIDVPITRAEQLGEWAFESPSAISDVFFFSGLTLVLDRDRESMVISGRDNSLIGKVVREAKYEGLLDLSVYQDKNLTLDIISDGQLIPVEGISVSVDDNGQFRIEGFQPPADLGSPISVRLTLDVGSPFQPIRAEFFLNVIDASVFPTAASDVIVLSTLTGPNGAAEGVFTLAGGSSDGGKFCIASQAVRTDDPATIGPESVERIDGFVWVFDGPGKEESASETCFVVGAGESPTITVSVTNPTQANSKVISVREVESSAQGTEVVFAENLTFEFETATERNDLVTILAVIALLLLGFLLPLTILYFLKRLIARFQWGADVVRADFNVVVVENASPIVQLADLVGNPLGPIALAPDTFLGTPPAGTVSTVSLGEHGNLVAKTPLNPLSSSWFEWVAPAGKRIVSTPETSFASQGKRFLGGRRAEANSSMAQNWALLIDEAELANPGPVKATLVMFAKRGPLADYEYRIRKITNDRQISDMVRILVSSVPVDVPGIVPPPDFGGPPAGVPLPPPPMAPPPSQP